MEKKTIIAIVLSTLVIIASLVLQQIIFPVKNSVPVENETVQVEENIENSQNSEESVLSSNDNLVIEKEAKDVIEEQKVTINTGLAEIVLTNKGGDIVSYLLNPENHKDTDTGLGVQISDNVSDFNRTCGIAFGDSNKKIINENFNVEVIDDYTVLFKKQLSVNNKSIILGKRYTFKPNEYLFKLEILLHSDEGFDSLNSEGAIYTIRSSPQIGPHYNPKENKYENRQYITYNGEKSKKTILSSNQFKINDKSFIWSGIAGKYFVELIIPENAGIINAGYYSSLIETNDYANAQSFIERKAVSGNDVSDTYYMYFGPRNEKDLKKYNTPEANAWLFGGKKLTDCLQSSGWLSWLEVILKWCLESIQKLVKNWGLSIIILTILLKLLMFPLSKKQSMGTLKMQALQPKMQVIQEKYKGDQQKLQAETAKLYSEAGYNPMSGCLPMVFQFLILFAMYNLFNNYFEFRGASFIPGWIPDLSAGDSVYKFKFTIPFLGNQLRILPIIYVASQLLFGKITQNGGMSSGQNGMSMKLMTYGMPLIFFFLFYNAPSGLLLYWTVSNLFQMGQQIIINNTMKKVKENPNENQISTKNKKRNK